MTAEHLTEICPTCHGDRSLATGRVDGDDVETAPCVTCQGMGRLAADDPALIWAHCPHCGSRIRIEAAAAEPTAHDCPECGGYYHIPYTDGVPHALGPDDVEF